MQLRSLEASKLRSYPVAGCPSLNVILSRRQSRRRRTLRLPLLLLLFFVFAVPLCLHLLLLLTQLRSFEASWLRSLCRSFPMVHVQLGTQSLS